MFKRLWFVIGCAWAACILFIGATDTSVPFNRKLFIIAAIPILATKLVRFIVYGPRPR